MTLETLFPVKKQATCIYTRNKVSGVSVFPNWSLGARKSSLRMKLNVEEDYFSSLALKCADKTRI